MFTVFSHEFCESSGCIARMITEEEPISKYLVGFGDKDDEMNIVSFDSRNNIANCCCRMFEFEGMLCKHVLQAPLDLPRRHSMFWGLFVTTSQCCGDLLIPFFNKAIAYHKKALALLCNTAIQVSIRIPQAIADLLEDSGVQLVKKYLVSAERVEMQFSPRGLFRAGQRFQSNVVPHGKKFKQTSKNRKKIIIGHTSREEIDLPSFSSELERLCPASRDPNSALKCLGALKCTPRDETFGGCCSICTFMTTDLTYGYSLMVLGTIGLMYGYILMVLGDETFGGCCSICTFRYNWLNVWIQPYGSRVTLLRLCRTRELHELGSESLFKVDVMPTCGGERWRSGMDTYDGSFYTAMAIWPTKLGGEILRFLICYRRDY
ncbi:hypothetical protein IFM89_010446 [Coptis chinensis]|uniref:SWIM-type domain-containing protein n=1 Tax=Coptis chinensis TaxID=261450 RepID=A0A835LXI3_9MAGN|nr:hypothetical protein IFM89_010446 [Coptis chinensis]